MVRDKLLATYEPRPFFELKYRVHVRIYLAVGYFDIEKKRTRIKLSTQS